ncbi:polyamine aminopropyltransferase [Desulfosoma caldarium]|uniref:Polyamine aminopropyltransferase n=1 Tax=Desulfosoma caldarium TaxID=610254 RepID=A0A3N1VFF9_9BACT|nr:polyamine aminopropyltransferase [Desulfosoma caldarium]ROR01596.1 spermidine synthase [Desulfosoma caldarium]
MEKHQRRLWFRELQSSGEETFYACRAVLYHGRSRYQQIDIVETEMHGRVLALDGVVQSAQLDEFIYHEVLVHPAMWSHPAPQSVLIIGGGEGATLREVCRHPDVRRIVMVEIDGELVEICRRLLPQWHQGAFDDPRVQLIIGDGRAFVENTTEKFDVAVLDLSDPIEDSPAALLFTKEFYDRVAKCLTPMGCVSVQGECISPQKLVAHARIVNTLKQVFPVVQPCSYSLHSFHRPDAHIVASKNPQWSVSAVVERARSMDMPLRYLSVPMVEKLFVVPPYLEEAYELHCEPLTDTAHQLTCEDLM